MTTPLDEAIRKLRRDAGAIDASTRWDLDHAIADALEESLQPPAEKRGEVPEPLPHEGNITCNFCGARSKAYGGTATSAQPCPARTHSPPPSREGEAVPKYDRGVYPVLFVATDPLYNGVLRYERATDANIAAVLQAMPEERRNRILELWAKEWRDEADRQNLVDGGRIVEPGVQLHEQKRRAEYFRREIHRLTEFNGSDENPEPTDADYIAAVELEINAEYERAEAAEERAAKAERELADMAQLRGYELNAARARVGRLATVEGLRPLTLHEQAAVHAFAESMKAEAIPAIVKALELRARLAHQIRTGEPKESPSRDSGAADGFHRPAHEQCQAINPDGGWICTLKRGHASSHEAWGDDRQDEGSLSMWETENVERKDPSETAEAPQEVPAQGGEANGGRMDPGRAGCVPEALRDAGATAGNVATPGLAADGGEVAAELRGLATDLLRSTRPESIDRVVTQLEALAAELEGAK